uniref:Uncharacterized protein n=1 Tax=Abalone asfa-like virus TaxID=2839893 RepID=A0A5K7XX27_9VIRU|nr:hypothetical protein [Abalone asfa-like virus]BCY04635.1 hypothetical protein [Abalone asfa-like virus]
MNSAQIKYQFLSGQNVNAVCSFLEPYIPGKSMMDLIEPISALMASFIDTHQDARIPPSAINKLFITDLLSTTYTQPHSLPPGVHNNLFKEDPEPPKNYSKMLLPSEDLEQIKDFMPAHSHTKIPPKGIARYHDYELETTATAEIVSSRMIPNVLPPQKSTLPYLPSNKNLI